MRTKVIYIKDKYDSGCTKKLLLHITSIGTPDLFEGASNSSNSGRPCMICPLRSLGACDYSEFGKYLIKDDKDEIKSFSGFNVVCDSLGLIKNKEIIYSYTILSIDEDKRKVFVPDQQSFSYVNLITEFCKPFCPLYSGKDLLCRLSDECPFKKRMENNLKTIDYD